jgi:hypothetical protein
MGAFVEQNTRGGPALTVRSVQVTANLCDCGLQGPYRRGHSAERASQLESTARSPVHSTSAI